MLTRDTSLKIAFIDFIQNLTKGHHDVINYHGRTSFEYVIYVILWP